MFVSGFVVHTVEVFRAEVEHVGSEFLRRSHPILAGHSLAKVLLTGRETLMNLAHLQKVSVERYPWR